MSELETMTDYQFMRTYRTSYWHTPTLKAKLDQEGAGYQPRSGGGEADAIAAETLRRGLSWPESWEAAGLDPHK